LETRTAADGPPRRETPVWTRSGPPFLAKYPERCRGCDTDIGFGQGAQRWDLGDEKAYTHARCEMP
jgi:hypothetical protein